MRARFPLFALAALLLACGDSGSRGSDAAPASSPPAGWISLEGDAQSKRLYYQFVDERRQVRFVESLDEVPEALRAGVGYVRMSVPPPLSPGDAQRARAKQSEDTLAALRASRLVLFSADWCGACRKAKRYLAERGAEFEERNVDIPAVAEELLRKTGERGIPVLELGGRVLTGFSESAYAELLGGS